jgi:DNA-binding LacI/PurR family transcriptional regulator
VTTTLRDVAELAQVSIKTVSNVVHGHPHVSDDVRGRVEKAIRQLGYRPNLAARALRTGRSGLISLALARVDASCPPGLIDQIIDQATRSGFQVVIEPIGSSSRRSALAERSARKARVEAMLVSVGTLTSPLAATQLPADIPLVLLAADLDPRYDCVALDAALAAREATEHLLRTGRRRIAAVGAHPDEADGPPRPRTLGYRQAIDHAGLRPPPTYLQPTLEQRHADGYRAAETLLNDRQPPDAIFCYNDRLASGVLRAAADAGLRVPEDLAVIGMGDSEEGRYSRPTLSTVATDPAFIARTALELLVRRLQGMTGAASQIVAPHVVTPRESTAPALRAPSKDLRWYEGTRPRR